MPRKIILILTLALVSGAAAIYLGFNVLREPGPPVAEREDGDLAPVVVAAREMEAGTILEPTDIKTVQWPRAAIPEGYGSSASEVVGRGLLTPVKLNEPLLSGKLASKEAGGGLPILIPEGMRALSVKVDQVIGVAGFILPGTRVDVAVTLDERQRQTEAVSQLFLQNIQVLTAGQRVERDPEGEPVTVPVVTVLVTPEEAEKLILASTKGQIQLALRNTLDPDTAATSGVRIADLLNPQARSGNPQPVAARSRRPAVPRRTQVSVDVYRGPEVTTSTVTDGGGQ